LRESAVFSGIPVAELPLAQRCCGVWVQSVASGRTIALVKFEDAVQEIFSVQVLPGALSPDEINDQPALLVDSFILPDEVLPAVPDPLRHATRPSNREASSFRRGD
jgi:hypothetical protein